MRAYGTVVVITLLLATSAHADIGAETWVRGASSVALNDDATAIFLNPAGLGMYRESGLFSSISMSGESVSAISIASKHGVFGVGYRRDYLWEPCSQCGGALHPGSEALDTYAVGVALGSPRNFAVGFDYRWLRPRCDELDNAGTWDVGVMYRPFDFLSLGGAVRNISEADLGSEGVVEARRGVPGRTGGTGTSRLTYVAGAAVRPFGNRLTLTGDWALDRGQAFEDAVYSVGVETEPLDGIVLRGSVRSYPGDGGERDEETSLGLWINTTHVGGGVSYRTFEPGANDVITYELGMSEERMRSILAFPGGIAEIRVEGPLADASPGWSLLRRPRKSAQRIIRDIRTAAKDPSVSAILLRIEPLGRSFLGAPSALVQEIRNEVVKARRENGVRVVAFLEYGAGTQEYFLATAADRIVITESSGLDGIGNYVNVMRYTGTTEKLGIEWDYISAGKYKSTFHSIGAGPLTDEQREEVQSLIDDGYEEILKAVMDGRGLSRGEAESLCDGRIFMSPQALDAGLVDEIGFYEDAKAAALELAGGDVPDNPEEITTLDVSPWRAKAYDWTYGPRIAVVGAYGNIGVGRGGHDPIWGGSSIGSETLVEELRRARKDPSVKAVILRIDSGGGSALASDIIWNETLKVAREKPFIVSMADIAGSGGYYIAMAAERIFVDPLTITGSIGVVGMKPVLGPMYEKIDATHETFKRGEHSDMWSTSRHATPEEYEMAEHAIDWFYDEFVRKVASGRKMDVERVREVAEGRVYTGNQAVEVGLADELGGLSDAIDYACRRIGVERDRATVLFYREGRSLVDRLMSQVATGLGLYRLLDLGDGGLDELLGLRMTGRFTD